MMLSDKSGERIYCGVEAGPLTRDIIRRLAPEVLSMTREEYVEHACSFVHKLKSSLYMYETYLESTKNLAGSHWDNIQEVYNMAKD